MPQTIHVGTILIEESSLTAGLFGLEIEHSWGNWNAVKTLDGFALDRKIRDAGWNFFFMAGEVKAVFLGAIEAKKIQNALQRIISKRRHEPYNALEVTGIVAKRFLGVPYTIISAHSRHIQQSCYLNDTRGRWTSQNTPQNGLEVEGALRLRRAES